MDGFDFTSSSPAVVLAADSVVSEMIETLPAKANKQENYEWTYNGNIPVVVLGTTSRVAVESGK